MKYLEYEIVYCIIKKLAQHKLFKDIEEFEEVYNFCKTLFDGLEKDFLTCLLYPDRLTGYSTHPHNYNQIENYSDLQTHLFKIKNSLVNTPAPPATEQPIKTKEFDNTTLTKIHNVDSIKELLDDSVIIELVDSEVNWIDCHKEINEFLHLKPLWKRYKFTIDNTPLQERSDKFKDDYYRLHHEAHWNWIKNLVTENESWKDRKILIKDVSSKHDPIRGYFKHLKDLSLYIKNNRRELNITDNDLQDLRNRREELTFTANSLHSLIMNEWGRDHEDLGGKLITNPETGIIPTGKYYSKFYLSKLWGILDKYCDAKISGSDYSHHSAKYFTTSKGEEVYVTKSFLNLLYDIFETRRSTFDDIIKYLEPNIPAPPATEQPTNTKEFDNTTLTQIMNDDMIDLFLKNEKRLRADEFITSENKWVNGRGKNQTKTLKDLANLILLLKEKNYLKLKFDRKKLKESDYKKFFEVRYGCNLKEQFGDAIKDRTNRLETSTGAFIYF